MGDEVALDERAGDVPGVSFCRLVRDGESGKGSVLDGVGLGGKLLWECFFENADYGAEVDAGVDGDERAFVPGLGERADEEGCGVVF